MVIIRAYLLAASVTFRRSYEPETWLPSEIGEFFLSMCRNGADRVAHMRDRICNAIAAALLVALACYCAKSALAAEQPLPKVDRILVLKSERKLLLLRDGAVLRSYPIALGPHPLGPKHASGDGRTPEGVYVIDGRHLHSPYRIALHISYPNATDRAQSSAAHADPGDAIFIHGLPAWYGSNDPDKFYKDWTKGCISVGNTAIEAISAAVDDGTPIEIRP
jgi:murein L,D-transpeptidase YafK